MSYIHGQAKHGKVTSVYYTWVQMRQRCNNLKHKRYKDWGGRGIRVCERWNSFLVFLEDIGPRPEGLTLDRINNNGNYEPGNCRWATPKEQNGNQRKRKDQYWFYGYGPNGEIVIENNKRKIAQIFNLDPGSIAHCLNNKYKTTHGWRFRRI